MKYVTLADLSETIRRNLWKIPRDIDFIIGVPRSGMIGASIISSYLNVPLIDINSFLAGLSPSGGLRLEYFYTTHTKFNRALVIDDTVSSGRAMDESRKKLSEIRSLTFIFSCVYLEGWGEKSVDLYLEDLRSYTENFTTIVLYEWNIFQHHPDLMSACLYDIDGVLCSEPPDERKEAEYLQYIENATPLFIPRTPIGGIITYRLIKNKEITEKWLQRQGVHYKELKMLNANTWEERNRSGISPERFKGEFYRDNSRYKLFVESSDQQAKEICRISGKSVFCVETNKMYQ